MRWKVPPVRLFFKASQDQDNKGSGSERVVHYGDITGTSVSTDRIVDVQRLFVLVCSALGELVSFSKPPFPHP